MLNVTRGRNAAALNAALLALLGNDARAAQLGEGCAQNSDCVAPATVCLQLDPGIKICTLPCTPDDPNTPLVIEDTCPMLSQHVCVSKPGSPANGYCLLTCTPSLTANPCPASSKQTCDPASVQIAGYASWSKAVCYTGACTSDADCPVYAAKTCTATADCSAVASDAFCDTDAGYCARPGSCSPGGICGAHGKGKAGAQVGDPCKSDFDCSNNGYCLTADVTGPHNDGAAAPNGYCTIPNCSFEQNLPAFACPVGSTCLSLGNGGRCLKTCQLAQAGDCRGHPQDRGGDYECYAWDNLSIYGAPAATQPVCQSAAEVPCTYFGSSPLDCTALGQASNPTNMACRDPSDGAVLTNAKDPAGRCLDDTTSGPYGPPPQPDQGVPDLGPTADAGPDVGPAADTGAPSADTGAPADSGATTADSSTPQGGDDDGCSCAATERRPARAPWLFLAALALLLRRRAS